MTDHDLDRIVAVLHRWDHLGLERAGNGTLLIGRVPHVAPEAWLHQLFPPALPEQLAVLDERFPGIVPDEYREVLKAANGMMLFSGELSVYGVRSSYRRTGVERWQPFDVFIANREERVPGTPSDAFFVGSYPLDGERVGIIGDSGVVFRCTRSDPTPLQSWPSLSTMLLEEVERFSEACDERGRLHLGH